MINNNKKVNQEFKILAKVPHPIWIIVKIKNNYLLTTIKNFY